MTYAKPQVVPLGPALAAIQHMDKGDLPPIENQYELQTIGAYEADE